VIGLHSPNFEAQPITKSTVTQPILPRRSTTTHSLGEKKGKVGYEKKRLRPRTKDLILYIS